MGGGEEGEKEKNGEREGSTQKMQQKEKGRTNELWVYVVCCCGLGYFTIILVEGKRPHISMSFTAHIVPGFPGKLTGPVADLNKSSQLSAPGLSKSGEAWVSSSNSDMFAQIMLPHSHMGGGLQTAHSIKQHQSYSCHNKLLK